MTEIEQHNKAWAYRLRYESFEQPIKDAALKSPIVQRILEEYAHGRIITKEECLSQMVVALAERWNQRFDEYVRFMAINPIKT